MEDRIPRGIIIVIGIFTILIMIVGAVGLWDDGGLDFLPDDLIKKQKDKAEAPVPPLPEEIDVGDFREPRELPPVEVVASWDTLQIKVPEHRLPGDSGPLNTHFSGTPLPEVRGQILASTPAKDGGVVDAVVDHGGDLQFSFERLSASRTRVTYSGRGRHARILAFITGSATRILTLLKPQTLGGRPSTFTITPPGILTGTVVGPSSIPVTGATVRAGEVVTTTDARGRFKLKGVRGTELLVNIEAPEYASHREILTLPPSFGTPGCPGLNPVIRLIPGQKLTIKVQYPTGRDQPSEGYTYFLIPYGHQLSLGTLATETMAHRRTTSASTLHYSGFPAGQDLCLVGHHPEMAFLYRRIRKAFSDLSITLKAKPLIKLEGRVTNKSTGKPVEDFAIETSVDGITLGQYLGQTRKIPTGHEAGNFPLPNLDFPLAWKRKTGENRFQVTFDPNVTPRVKVRFTAPGYHAATINHISLSQRQNVELLPVTLPRADSAEVILTVNLSGSRKISSFRSFGLKNAPDPLKSPGRLRVRFPDVPPGQYSLTLKAEGYEPYTRTLNIISGSIRKVPAFLSPARL